MENIATSKKDLEANGHVDDTPSEGSSEQLNPYRKRSRRMEYLYISIAVVLGAALIGVLVYFSVTNAMKDDPEPVASSLSGTATTTTTEANDEGNYDDLFGDSAFGGSDTGSKGGLNPSDNLRNMSPGQGGPMMRSEPGGSMLRKLTPPSQDTPAPSPDTPSDDTRSEGLSLVGGSNGGTGGPGFMLRGIPRPSEDDTPAQSQDTPSGTGGQAGTMLRGLPRPSEDDTPAQSQDTPSVSGTATTTTEANDEGNYDDLFGDSAFGGSDTAMQTGQAGPMTRGGRGDDTGTGGGLSLVGGSNGGTGGQAGTMLRRITPPSQNTPAPSQDTPSGNTGTRVLSPVGTSSNDQSNGDSSDSSGSSGSTGSTGGSSVGSSGPQLRSLRTLRRVAGPPTSDTDASDDGPVNTGLGSDESEDEQEM